MSSRKDVGTEIGLSGKERLFLAALARRSVESAVNGEPPAPVPHAGGLLEREYRVFVSIHKQGMLRGCMGSPAGEAPLASAVVDAARAAASEDPRFWPLMQEELTHISLEISVLTPMERITGPEEIHVGIHGVFVQKGSMSGLLLPQVASELHWDAVTFLEHACEKAGLHRSAWEEPDTEIRIFSAEVFEERDDRGDEPV
ncbi:MAG: AmmeMemoRadiSam system protein A [Pseudomonadota bacterium]